MSWAPYLTSYRPSTRWSRYTNRGTGLAPQQAVCWVHTRLSSFKSTQILRSNQNLALHLPLNKLHDDFWIWTQSICWHREKEKEDKKIFSIFQALESAFKLLTNQKKRYLNIDFHLLYVVSGCVCVCACVYVCVCARMCVGVCTYPMCLHSYTSTENSRINTRLSESGLGFRSSARPSLPAVLNLTIRTTGELKGDPGLTLPTVKEKCLDF